MSSVIISQHARPDIVAMKRSIPFDAMDIDCDGNGTNTQLCPNDGHDNIAVETGDSPKINIESEQPPSTSPPPRREPPPLYRPSRPSASLFDETDITTLGPASSGSFETVGAQRHVQSHNTWQQLRRGHQIERIDLDLESNFDRLDEDDVVTTNVGDQNSYQYRETASFANMEMIVPYEFETESTRGVLNRNTDHDDTDVGSTYDTVGPPWLPIQRSGSDSDNESIQAMSPSSPYENYIDEDETLVYMRFGFHYCEQCIPVPDPPTALCSTCRAPLRERRLLRGPIEGFHRYENYPGPRYFHHARHDCDTCWLTGVCDICGYFLRDFRPE